MKKLQWQKLSGSVLGALLIHSPGAFAFDIGWNGFGSAYYSQAINPNLMPFGLTSTHVNFTTLSLMGLNVSGRINDDLHFAGQLVALGNPVGTSDTFAINAQWAHFSYRPIDGLTINGGRQLYPVFLASEYARVGFLLPYRQIPSTVFLISPFTRFDGLSVSYSAEIPVGRLTFGLFGGTPLLDISTTALSAVQQVSTLADLLGAQITLDGDGWRLKGMVSRNFTGANSTAIPASFPALGGHEQTFTAGYRFDKHNLVTWGEYVMVRTPDGSPAGGGQFIGNGHGYYLLAGYRLGRFMPRYTFSEASSTFNYPYGSFAAIAANGSVTTHTFGINYQAGAQALVKVEYEHDIAPSAPGPFGYFASGPASATDTTGDAFFVGVDFIF